MTSHILELFNHLKCNTHQQSSIVQLCISSMCPQQNRVCCLQCVDQCHTGPQHTLISLHKFDKLMEKQQLNEVLLQNMKQNQLEVNSHINKYFTYIEDSLIKENELTSYEQLNQIDFKSCESQQIKKRLNEVIDNHSWILEINSKQKQSESQENTQHAVHAIRSKYSKLEKRLNQINKNCELQLKQVLEKRSSQIKKLFHLFDEIKYKIEDDGQQLQKVAQSLSKLNVCAESPVRQNHTKEDSEKKKVKQMFDFMGNLAGSE